MLPSHAATANGSEVAGARAGPPPAAALSYNEGAAGSPLSRIPGAGTPLTRKTQPMLRTFAFLGLATLAAAPLWADDPAHWAQDHNEELVKLYRHFHQHPELSFQEKETAARLAQELKSAGYDVTTGIGGTGVVGLLKNGPGPTLMLRTDLDALPVTENTNLVYARRSR